MLKLIRDEEVNWSEGSKKGERRNQDVGTNYVTDIIMEVKREVVIIGRERYDEV